MKDNVIIFEGICRYCGQIKSVFAKTQEEADLLASEECECVGADIKKRKEAIEKNSALIVEDGNTAIICMLRMAGEMILNEEISQLTLNTGELRYKVGANAKGQIKFTRTKTKQEELQG